MKPEMYVFQCQECNHIYAEPYSPMDMFAKYPECPDCGNKLVVSYEGEISEDMQRAIDEYNEENGIEE